MKKLSLLSILLFLTLNIFGQKQLTNVPTFYITTENQEPIVEKSKYLKGELTIVSSDEKENFTGKMKIKGRGNSTWTFAKKPFKIKLDKKAKLLNQKAKAKKWVLLANYCDKSLLRNGVAFKISELLGFEFTPSARFVDVVFNGELLGSYMMSDQVEVKKGRVPVEEQEKEDTTEPNITGGYLLELDGFAQSEPVYFKTNKKVLITIKYPKDDEINNAQREYITNYTKHFEDILFSPNFKDAKTGYRAYVDTKSLIDWYIACELTGNSDSFWSTYIYKKRNDPKFYFGPMWDYDIAFNNDMRLKDATEKLMREHAHNPKTWIKRFWEDDWFQKEVSKRWKELVESGIENKLINYINQTKDLLDKSQQLNYTIWKTLGKRVYREQFVFPTYDENVEYLKTYVRERIEFLNSSFSEGGTDPIDEFQYEKNAYYNIINKKSGNAIDVSNKTTKDGIKLMLWKPTKDKLSQHWRLVKDDNGYFTIINRKNGKAIKALGSKGANIVVSNLTNSDDFKWNITKTPIKKYFGVVGKAFGYSFNNSGGSLNNGTPLIEWNSNINTSENSKFTFVKVGTTNLMQPQSEPLKIWYNLSNQTVQIDFNNILLDKNSSIKVYSLNGLKVLDKNHLYSNIDVSKLSNGIYLIKLIAKNKIYSTKFIKQ